MSGGTGSVAHELYGLQRANVLIVGDVMLDRYIHGEVDRVSPEAPVPVVMQQGTRLVLGGAANVAANIASIGARAMLIGRVGADQDASEIVTLLDALHVRHYLVTVPGVPTITKTRIVVGTQQVTRIDNEIIYTTTPDEAAAVLDRVKEFLSRDGYRAVILADYAKGFLEADLIREVIRFSVEADVPVISDPKGRNLSRYAGSTVIKPNLIEARIACSLPSDRYTNRLEEISALADACVKTSGARNVVLSCSADGVAVFGTDVPEVKHLAANAREVADVSGAGDTLVALIALGLAAELPLSRAVELANIAAGAVCEKSGTATVTATELLALISGNSEPRGSEPSPKILASHQEAGQIGARYHIEGRRLVFANGCFDLLHAGHIKLLKDARSFGDALMVGLNTDESVRRLKGASRPIQSESDRCEIIAALACVDFVVLFEQDTPLELINTVRPSLLVKGDDYSVESVVGTSEIETWGGAVVLVSQLDNRSTTRIIAAAR